MTYILNSVLRCQSDHVEGQTAMRLLRVCRRRCRLHDYRSAHVEGQLMTVWHIDTTWQQPTTSAFGQWPNMDGQQCAYVNTYVNFYDTQCSKFWTMPCRWQQTSNGYINNKSGVNALPSDTCSCKIMQNHSQHPTPTNHPTHTHLWQIRSADGTVHLITQYTHTSRTAETDHMITTSQCEDCHHLTAHSTDLLATLRNFSRHFVDYHSVLLLQVGIRLCLHGAIGLLYQRLQPFRPVMKSGNEFFSEIIE